jgi:NAD(P)-dependent dehydrogenase (short-subunit alcohol dehydrogenase family)
MDLQLKNKLSLVSGSTAGIGYAIAAALAAEGAKAIVNGRLQASVDDAVAKLSAGAIGELIGFAGDLAQATVAEKLVQAHPGVEILINNLGIFEPNAFEDISDNDWRRFYEVNVLSGFHLNDLTRFHE